MTKPKKNPGCAKCVRFRNGIADDNFSCETGRMLDHWLSGPQSYPEFRNPEIRNKNLDCPDFEEKVQ